MTESQQAQKQSAVEFLQMIVAGKIEEAYKKYINPQGKHHNSFVPAGFPALKQSMIANHAQYPNKQLKVKHIFSGNNLVAVHSHLQLSPSGPDLATVHMFRFQDKRIAEMWDCVQTLPADSPNKDEAF